MNLIFINNFKIKGTIMSENNNLKNLCDNTYTNLSKTIELIEALDEILDGERKSYVLLMYIKENIKTSLKNIEICKNIISYE